MSQTPRGFVLSLGEGESPALPESTVVFKLVSADSGGSHSVIETVVPPGFPGPPAHFHRAIDEEFYVLDGELIVRVGEQSLTVGRGGYAYLPRGVVHTFTNRSDRPVTFLDIVHPAGFEQYFRDLAAAFREAGGVPSRETWAGLLARYDTEVVPAGG